MYSLYQYFRAHSICQHLLCVARFWQKCEILHLASQTCSYLNIHIQSEQSTQLEVLRPIFSQIWLQAEPNFLNMSSSIAINLSNFSVSLPGHQTHLSTWNSLRHGQICKKASKLIKAWDWQHFLNCNENTIHYLKKEKSTVLKPVQLSIRYKLGRELGEQSEFI